MTMTTDMLAAGALLCLGVIALALLAERLARVTAYRAAGWRVRAMAFGGFCLIREGGKWSLKPGSLAAGKGVLSLSTAIPETPDITTQEDYEQARGVLVKANRLSPSAKLYREGDLMPAYVLYAMLSLQEDGALRREKNSFLRDKLAQALGELPPDKAGRHALEAFDLLLMEHMAHPDWPASPALERWLDHFAQDYQTLRRGKGAEIYPVLFLHVLYALKLRGDDRWKVMEAHVSTVLKVLPGGGVNAYYRLQALQMIYNEDHREALAKRENIRQCGAWRLYGLFGDAMDDEMRLNRR